MFATMNLVANLHGLVFTTNFLRPEVGDVADRTPAVSIISVLPTLIKMQRRLSNYVNIAL